MEDHTPSPSIGFEWGLFFQEKPLWGAGGGREVEALMMSCGNLGHHHKHHARGAGPLFF